MQDVVTKSVTKTADSIVTREIRGEERELLRVPISSTRQDRDGDAFAEEALRGMRDQIRSEQPLVFQNHGFTDFNKPLYDQRDSIGTQVDAEIDDVKDGDGGDQELAALVLPDQTHDEGERMLQQAKDGQAIKFSVGFRVLEADAINPEDENDDRRLFQEADLMETSKVGIPSNPDATATVAAKAAGLTERLGEAGLEIEDETAFASALAAELVEKNEPDPQRIEGVSRQPPSRRHILRSSRETKPKCDSDADCPDGEECEDGHCVEMDSFDMDEDTLRNIVRDEIETVLDERDAPEDDDDESAEQDGATTLSDADTDELLEALEESDYDPVAAESDTEMASPTLGSDDDEAGKSLAEQL
jgi:hypothetical protein